jgi:ParB family chromosome partitioning protein
MSATELPLTKLRRRTDARPLRAETINGLADSIREIGVINPLRVRPISIFEMGIETEGWEITAGRHRFEAAQRAGLAAVPCIIVTDDDLHAELAMIDENLMRAELSPADRASGTARRKEIYIELHPETANGANQHTRDGQVVQPSFAKATADAIGVDARTVRRDAERGEKISPAVIELVHGTKLDKGTYLDRLKNVDRAEQEAVVRRDLAAPRAPISPAPAPRNEFESEQAWLAKVVKLFDAAPMEWRERARDHLFPDIPTMDRRTA